MKIKDREAFIVLEVDKTKHSILCQSRVTNKEVSMKTDKKKYVTLLHEKDILNDGETGNLF